MPSACIEAFVHQCDSGEALINSSLTLGYPPPISLNTHTKTQTHESHNSAAEARQLKSFIHLSASVSLQGSPVPTLHTPLISAPPSVIHVFISS